MSSTPTLEGQKTLTINEISEQIEAGLLRPGALVDGTLGSQEGDFFVVDLDGTRGRLPADELQGQSAGDTITLFVEEVGEGDVLLSLHKAERLAVWNWLEEQRESGTAVKVKVISESRGALAVELKGLKAILAHRDLETGTPRDINVLRG